MSAEFRELARRLRRLEEGVKAQNVPQLAHSSVEDGAIEHYDRDGQLTAIVGRQHDDTVAPIVVTGPIPAAPTGLSVTGGQLQVTATWDGTWEGGAVAPMDFARVEVHTGTSQDFEVDPLPMSSTRVATIESPGGASVTWQATPGEVWVTIVARTLPGKVSEHRELVMVEVDGAVDPAIFEQARKDIDAAKANLATTTADLAQARVDLYDPTGRVAQIKDTLTGKIDDAASRAQEALDTANQTVITAGGGSVITWSQNEPAVREGTKVSDTWYRYEIVEGRMRLIGSWQWDGSAWQAVELAESFLPRVNIGTGTYGELDGMRLKAKSVQADAILVPGSAGSTVIADGAITSSKIVAQDIAGAVAAFIKLDASQLVVTENATIAQAVIDKLFAQTFAAHKITGDEIDAAKVSGAIGDFVKVRAENIQAGSLMTTIGMGTSGQIIAGDTSKIFARMDSTGFTTWNVAEDGSQFLGTSLGSTIGTDALTITNGDGVPTASITGEGNASLEGLDVDSDPTIMGRPLLGRRVDPASDAGILDDAGRGLVAMGYLNANIDGSTLLPTGYTPLAVIGFQMDGRRTYHVSMPFRYDVSNVSGMGRAGIALFYTWKGVKTGEADEPAVSSTRVMDFLDAYPASVAGVSNRVDFMWPSPFNSLINIKLLVCSWSGNCQLTLSNYNPFDWKMSVVDVGPNQQDAARLLDLPSSGATSSDSTTTSAPAAKKTYVATYYGSASQQYGGSGAKTSFNGSSKGLIQHGSPTGSSSQNNRGAVVFNGAAFDSEKKTIRDALSGGATLTKAEVFLKFPHWWYSTGGTATLHPLASNALPDTLSSVSGSKVTKRYTARGQGYWIEIPTTWITQTATGIVVGPADTNSTAGYGYWYALANVSAADRVKLRLTYTR